MAEILPITGKRPINGQHSGPQPTNIDQNAASVSVDERRGHAFLFSESRPPRSGTLEAGHLFPAEQDQ
jgi:hypothetical protein